MERRVLLSVTVIFLPLIVFSSVVIASADPTFSSQSTEAKPTWTLDDCFNLALNRNERLAIVREDLFQADLLRDRSIAALFPEVSVRGTYFRQAEVPAGTIGTVTRFFDPTRVESLFKLQYSIFDARQFAALSYVDHVRAARRSSLRQRRLDLFLQVSEAFYETVKAQREIGILEESVRLQQERLREVKARQNQGLARKTETLLIETEVADAEARLVRARNLLDASRERLGFLIGGDVDRPLIDTLEEKALPDDLQQLIDEAMRMRSDLKESESQVRSARSQISVAKGEFLPTLDLTLNRYNRREGFFTDIDWDVQVEINFPFFQGGNSRARYREAVSRYRQSRLAESALQRQIRMDVKTAYLNLRSSDALLATLQVELSAAEESHRLIQEEYRQGLATNLEVLIAYNRLENARLQLDRERLNRKMAWIRLHGAMGVLAIEEEE
jgi:outer membrane protein TolC